MQPTNLADLREKLAAATPGVWRFTHAKSGRNQVSNGTVQVCMVWGTREHPAEATGKAIAALHNAAPAMIAELEALRSEVAERDKEHEALLALCRSKLGTMDVHGIADGIEALAAEVGRLKRERDQEIESMAGAWLAERDAAMKRAGAAAWLEAHVDRQTVEIVNVSYRTHDVFDADAKRYMRQQAAALRKGGE